MNTHGETMPHLVILCHQIKPSVPGMEHNIQYIELLDKGFPQIPSVPIPLEHHRLSFSLHNLMARLYC